MKQILQAPLLTPDEKSTLYSNELHRFQSFQNQLQNQVRSPNNLQTQIQSFLTTATNSHEAADDTDVKESDSGNKDRYEDSDHHITITTRNDTRNSDQIGSLTSYYLRNHNRNRSY